MTTPDILGKIVLLNGEVLELLRGAELPRIEPALLESNGVSMIRIPALSYCFLRVDSINREGEAQ